MGVGGGECVLLIKLLKNTTNIGIFLYRTRFIEEDDSVVTS